MIDLHCHLLPGLDDGPAMLDDALALCRLAVANGITRAVATPHITPGRYENTLDSITVAHRQFLIEMEKAGIELELGFAAEVRLDSMVPGLLRAGQLPFLGEYDNKPVLLIEFPHTHIPPGSAEFIGWLFKEGIQPIIAHPERNRDVMRDFSKITPYVEVGCLFQVTAPSLTGLFGVLPRKRGIQMLRQGWVTILASDAHNLHLRTPDLEPGRQVAEKIVGKTASWELVREMPERLLRAKV